MGSHKLSHYQFLRLQIPRFLPVFLRPNRNSVLVQCDLYFIDRLFPGTCDGNFSAEFLSEYLSPILMERLGAEDITPILGMRSSKGVEFPINTWEVIAVESSIKKLGYLRIIVYLHCKF